MNENRNLGAIVKGIRKQRGITLAEMSELSGIPVSTLSKIEHGKLTLTYDKLLQFSEALSIPISDLFTDPTPPVAAVTARRSIATLDNAIRVETPNYVYHYLCSDLSKRRLIPIQVEITARSLEDFGELVRHSGEEFAMVTEGEIVFHSEFYSPVTLAMGEGIYIDSSMGHAYLLAEGCERAVVVSVCTSDAKNPQESLAAEAKN